MTPLEYENAKLKHQLWDLAYRLDPCHWEAVLRESDQAATELIEAEIKDQRTSPRLRAVETKVYWQQGDSVRVLEKKIP